MTIIMLEQNIAFLLQNNLQNKLNIVLNIPGMPGFGWCVVGNYTLEDVVPLVYILHTIIIWMKAEPALINKHSCTIQSPSYCDTIGDM